MKLWNWKIGSKDEKGLRAWGNVTGHPRISDGTYIHTSKIIEAWIEGTTQCIWILTQTEHLYQLEWRTFCEGWNTWDMISNWDDTQDALQAMGISGKLFSTYIERKAKWEETISNIIGESELYLEAAGNHILKAYYRGSAGIRELQIWDHAGMFMDSVYVEDREKGEARAAMLIVRDNVFQFYQWTDKIERINIKNAGSKDLWFEIDDVVLATIIPGKTETIQRDTYTFAQDFLKGERDDNCR